VVLRPHENGGFAFFGKNMKRIFLYKLIFILTFSSQTTSVHAVESEFTFISPSLNAGQEEVLLTASDLDGLSLRINTIGERRRSYASLTDLYGLDILTPASTAAESAWAEHISATRTATLASLFITTHPESVAAERVAARSMELGLFHQSDSVEVFLRDSNTDIAETPINYPFYTVILLLLCVTVFILYQRHYKHKKEQQNVFDNNPAPTWK
jgi:hypothetical protein